MRLLRESGYSCEGLLVRVVGGGTHFFQSPVILKRAEGALASAVLGELVVKALVTAYVVVACKGMYTGRLPYLKSILQRLLVYQEKLKLRAKADIIDQRINK